MKENDKHFRAALKQIQSKADRDTGGMLLGKRMVHRNAKTYNRRDMRLRDQKAEW